ncbi:MAG: YitT family protein [Syntrophomonadaceae bacterium]|nr:YitT family protein [Syntrophomonadaceae bacterium]MDD4550333.1 YitT family protein [Syntrophomonadaceae bacterium]
MKALEFKEKIHIKDIIGILVGSVIMILGIQAVLVPANMITGGVTGIAIILNYFTEIDLWIWFLGLNIPLFVAGYKFVSRRFALYSLLGVVVQSILLALLSSLDFHIDNLLLSAVLGGVLVGLGAGIIFSSKGSSGGTDIIAVIFKRYKGYEIGQTIFVSNIIVLALSLLMFNIELALFSAISIFISARVVDKVEAGLHVTRTAMIISEECSDIANTILNNLHRGCTYLLARGAYSGDDKNIIMVTVGKTQLPRLKEIVFEVDPKAFIIINETIEVYGQGFQSSAADF